jgi:protoporphyrinogen oxidase
MLGLTLAHELARAGETVTVFEGAPTIGGLASSWQLGDVHWDRHYHVILHQDEGTLGVIEGLGLGDRVRWVKTGTGYFDGTSLYPVSTAADFARLPALGLVAKGRIGVTLVYGALVRNGRRMEQIGVDRWLRRWSGAAAYERFWLPLLRAKLGDNHRHASAAFIWATIRRLARARKTGLRSDELGYVEGGYATVFERYAEVLAADGVKVRTSARAVSVESAGGSPHVLLTDGGREEFDRVVITAAAPVVARLVPDLTDGERTRFADVRYQGIVCASLLLRRPLSPYYLTYITDPDAPFTAVVDMSALIDPDQLGGRGLVYLPKYVVPEDPLLQADDDAVREMFVPYLRDMHPELTDDDLLAFQVSRVPYVLAVATLGFSDALPPTQTSVPGVSVVSSAHIVNGTLNVDETVRLALAAVPRLLES